MNWIRRFMEGRYGGDQLSMALIILSLALTIIGQITKLALFWTISYIPLGISVFRMFSKNINKRSMENYKFAIFISPIYSRFKKFQRCIKDRRTHRFFRCPSCKTKLRLPKGKGKIIITCPKCQAKFNKRT